MEDNFPKFQWSMFINGKSEQVVVRGNIWADFVLDIEKARKEFKNESVVTEEPPMPDEEPEEPHTLASNVGFCTEHDIQMKKNVNGKWYHRDYKEDKGARFCNGRGYSEWKK